MNLISKVSSWVPHRPPLCPSGLEATIGRGSQKTFSWCSGHFASLDMNPSQTAKQQQVKGDQHLFGHAGCCQGTPLLAVY